MNEGQRRRIAIEMEGAVGFPPIFEVENGSIEVMIPIGHAGRGDCSIANMPLFFPPNLEFELVRIDANGKVHSRRTALYMIAPVR